MTDLKTLIYVIEQRISIAERNNQAFVDLPYDTVGAVLAILKEQEDLGTELTNAVELIHKKNERIEKLLKEQEHKDRMFHALEEDWKKLKEQDVVRCKDCEHATMTADGKMCKYCEMDTDDFGYQQNVYHDADWFCADGERRDSDA